MSVDIFDVIGTEVERCPKCDRLGQPRIRQLDSSGLRFLITDCGLRSDSLSSRRPCHYAPAGEGAFCGYSWTNLNGIDILRS